MTYKKLLENIYYAALHHEELTNSIKNDLLQEDWVRQKAEGSMNAYAHIKQMIVQYDSIGATDYKKVFKMENLKPHFLK